LHAQQQLADAGLKLTQTQQNLADSVEVQQRMPQRTQALGRTAVTRGPKGQITGNNPTQTQDADNYLHSAAPDDVDLLP
jgi:hypothetical protein